MELTELQRQVHKTAVEHGWWDTPRSFGDMIALMHSELSEAYECYRAGNTLHWTWLNDGKPEGVGYELADLAIRLLDFFEGNGMSLEGYIISKDGYNRTRPYRHGGKVT